MNKLKILKSRIKALQVLKPYEKAGLEDTMLMSVTTMEHFLYLVEAVKHQIEVNEDGTTMTLMLAYKALTSAPGSEDQS